MVVDKNQSSNGSQKAYTRDAIGRQNKATLSGGSLSGNYTRSYDAEDHLLSHAFTTYTTPSLRPDCSGNDADDAKYTGTHSYVWGPNGHPIKMDNETLHWDGDTLLYTSNSSGTVDDVKTGLLADSSPGSNGNIAYDRDDSGVVVSTHNSTGFSGWTPPDAYGQRCAAGAPASSTTYQNSFVNTTFGPVNGPAADGISDTFNVTQGGHGYDSKTGQWISPDALGESGGDPMSGKPLMWNRNNAFLFTDATGLDGTINGYAYGGAATCSNSSYASTPGSGCTPPTIASVGSYTDQTGDTTVGMDPGLAVSGPGVPTGGIALVLLGVGLLIPGLDILDAAAIGADVAAEGVAAAESASAAGSEAAAAEAGAADAAGGSGVNFVTTPSGVSVPVSSTFDVSGTSGGVLAQEPGSIGAANSVRIMQPNSLNPSGYIRYFNDRGQALDAFGANNNPAGLSATHLDITGGPYPGYYTWLRNYLP